MVMSCRAFDPITQPSSADVVWLILLNGKMVSVLTLSFSILLAHVVKKQEPALSLEASALVMFLHSFT